MKIKNIFPIILLLGSAILYVRPVVITFGTIITVAGLAKMVTEDVLTAWEFVDSSSPNMEADLPLIKHKQKKLFSRLTAISEQISTVENRITNSAKWTIDTMENFMITNTKLELGLHEMTDMMNRISVHEKRMKDYSEHLNVLETYTIEQFAEFIVSPNSVGIQSLLDRIHLLVTGSSDLKTIGNTGLLYLVAQNIKETNSYVCNAHQSPQQVLLQLYNAISVTELKGYAMMQFAWMLLKTYNRGNYTGEAKLMRKRFQDRTEKTQEVLRNVLQRSDRTVWRCDPNHHVQDETYVQLTRLLQGYIENEVDLNGDETCKETCNFYQYTESHGCFKNKFCARQQKCHGKILSCQFVDSDMWICPSQQNGNSTRRYDYIEYENGRILGKKGSCSRGTDKVDSWWRYLFWHCSYCFCLCDEQGAKSDRYFNLREVVSNTTANKIVTGLRFIKKNRIVYLQIQEGELIMRGNINTGTVEWKAIDIFDIRTRGIRNGVDYHTMAWDKRAIDLDDLIAEAGHVVTGVRFRVVGTHLNLEIRVTEMDFVNGKLIDPEHTSVWISNDNTDTSKDKRTQIHLYKPDVPTNNRGRSQIDSKTNQYIEFTNTDINEDAAQSTVPFIDAQDVISEPPVPLSGVGIYHKGTNNYGGFVAPKLFTYDFTPHIYTPKEDDE